MRKKYLITGGFGLIGFNLATILAIDNIVDILDFDKNAHGEKKLVINRIEYGDEHTDSVFKEEPVENVRYGSYDVIFHLAAVSSINSSFLDPVKTAEVNVLETIKLLESIKNSDPRNTKLVFASSFTVHNEKHSHYSLSKKVCEQYCEMYKELYGMNIAIARIANAYGISSPGPGSRKGIISALIQQHRKKIPLVIQGDGNQTRDFIHVDDIASGLIEISNLSGTFELCTGITKSINEIADLLGGEKTYIPASSCEYFKSVVSKPNIPNWHAKVSIEDYLKGYLKAQAGR